MSGRGVLSCAIAGMATFITMAGRPVAAQTADAALQVRRSAHATSHLGVRAFALVETESMLAADTFGAVLDTHVLQARGGGAEVLNIWKGLFVRVAATRSSGTGSRVVVVDDRAISLGIPLTIELRPVEFGGGWRRALGQRGGGAWYAGGGLLHLVYRETSTFASVGENTDTTFNGAVIFAGADVRLWRFIVGGGEVQFRTVPNAIGDAGASQAFKETDLGGVVARGVIGVRF
jgi:hypothetical protein